MMTKEMDPASAWDKHEEASDEPKSAISMIPKYQLDNGNLIMHTMKRVKLRSSVLSGKGNMGVSITALSTSF